MKINKSTPKSRRLRNNAQEKKDHTPFFSKKADTLIQKKKETTFFQPKLTIGQPNDKYEQEADKMADAVTHKSAKTPTVQAKNISSIQRVQEEEMGTNTQRIEKDKAIQEKPEVQRMENEEEAVQKMEEEEPIQKMEAEETLQKQEAEESLQTKSNTATNTVSPQVTQTLQNAKGQGSPLPNRTNREMSQAFGYDFSQVKIHQGSTSEQLNQELGAQAFTHGKDIYFNRGKYSPESTAGKQLLAHELTHVVQQGQAKAAQKADTPHVQKQAVPTHRQVRNISTPIQRGVRPNRAGNVVFNVGQVRVRILRDRRSSADNMRNRAETNFDFGRWRISNIVLNPDGTVRSFRGPGRVAVTIQTTYGPGVNAQSSSGYGRGTTTEDQQAANTTLGFHEGQHGLDYVRYITQHPFPQFTGTVGMSDPDFQAAMTAYGEARQAYIAAMSEDSLHRTDCVGTTIDENGGTSHCVTE